jgi:hypothetical protein
VDLRRQGSPAARGSTWHGAVADGQRHGSPARAGIVPTHSR